jgi:hypothetical protein
MENGMRIGNRHFRSWRKLLIQLENAWTAATLFCQQGVHRAALSDIFTSGRSPAHRSEAPHLPGHRTKITAVINQSLTKIAPVLS